MKYIYTYIAILGILFIAPIFVKDDISRLIFHIIYFIALIIFSVLAWQRNKKNEIIIYIFLMITGVIQVFDKEDKYFIVQIIALIVLAVISFLIWRKKRTSIEK